MADIYLNAKKDEKAYASCFKEIAARNPTFESWLHLGEAYITIHEVKVFLHTA